MEVDVVLMILLQCKENKETASAGKSLQGLFLWRNYGIQEDQLCRAGLVHPQV